MDSFAMIALLLVLIGIILYFRVCSSAKKCCDNRVMDQIELPVKVKEQVTIKTTKPRKPKKKRVYKRKKKK